MKVGDVFSYAFGAIRLRKLRAGLTTLGVVIGIAAIVALLSISQGLQVTITNQLQSGFATDTLVVSPGSGGEFSGFGGGFGGGGSDFSLLVTDTQILNQIDGVVTSTPILQKLCIIESGDQAVTTYVVGVDFEVYSEIYSSTFVAGSGEILLSPDAGLVVGQRVSNPYQNGTIVTTAGDTVEIIWTNTTVRPAENVTYSIAVDAVLDEIGGLSIVSPSDSAVYIPISQAQTFFGTDECDRIIVQLTSDDTQTIESVTEAIEEAFGDQVSVSSSTAILNTISTVFSTIELFLAGIAAISLLVAGVGIMNIMIVSLMERTREIGILKALGMKSRTVLAIFISESVLIGILGAVFGIGLGWLLANVAARIFTGGGFTAATGQQISQGGFVINPVLSPEVLLGAFAFGIAISVIFAIYPAWRASKLKPVDALRYE
jgi:putative ABC transport system permease protein